MLNFVRKLPGRLCLLSTLLALLSACVSRYDRVDDVHPLSDECKDYAAFSKAIAKQRDNGFTKRATMSMFSASVGNRHDSDIIYERYQTITDIAYEDLLINPDSIKVMGKIICEQRQAGTWHPLQPDDIRPVTVMLRACRKTSLTPVEMEDCIIAYLQVYWTKDLSAPPAFSGN
jgi:hypothetical protein